MYAKSKMQHVDNIKIKTHQLHAYSTNEGASEHGKPGPEGHNVKTEFERLHTRCRIGPLEEVGQREEAKVDDRELPKQPLLRRSGCLIKVLTRIDLPVQLSPTTKVFLDHDGNDEEGEDHDESLDSVGESNARKAAHVFEKEDNDADTNHWSVVVRIQPKDGIERGTDGRALSRQINDAGKDLQRDGRVAQDLGTESIGDEIGWRLMIANQAGLAKSGSRPEVSNADECGGGQPAK